MKTYDHKKIENKWQKDWDKKKIEQLKANRDQTNLFEHPEDPFEVVQKLPYKFSFIFEDDEGKQSKLMIEDWETGQLFWKCLAKHESNEAKAIQDVKNKYFEDFASCLVEHPLVSLFFRVD